MSGYIEVHTERNSFRLSGRPCEISSYAFVPKNRNDPPERTYFNTPQTQGQNIDERIKRPGSATYDRLFKYPEGYNNKLHRDDREHAKSQGLHVNHEVSLYVVSLCY
ncbi:hypothetical protein SNE40_013108 [Patella caerulea]|uniref:Uncharacterized protein n=1 Tax=Patella caerulea TaxID=87958 RepID=A0AAN8JLN6_PATCE